jgi:beta-glucanase (GH16 family)
MCKFLDDPDPSKLIWSDEFNVDGPPDPSNWGFDLDDGCQINLCSWGNGEQAWMTNLPSNVKVTNGILRITAKKEPNYKLPYTSARIVTRGLRTFKYGRVQFRARLANCKARGTWPALWMLAEKNVYGGWPKSGEIDVMEAVGYQPDRFFGTIHTELYNGLKGTQRGGNIALSKDDWHTFEINWEPDRIQFAASGQIYFEYQRMPGSSSAAWPYDQDFHIIMNIAVGGAWGGVEGIDESAFMGNGQTMEIDWVRVYDNTLTCPAPATSPTTITFEAECYLSMQGVQTEDTNDVGGGKNVGYIDTGDWMSYPEVTIPSTGTYRVEYRVASGSSGGGSLQLEKAGGTQVYGTVSIPNTGGWQNWQTVSHTVDLNAGSIAFGIKAIGGGWNINKFTLTMTSLPTPKPTTRKPTQVPTNEPTTESPTTESPSIVVPITAKPTTSKPTTRKPSTRKPTTRKPTTRKPTTRKPTQMPTNEPTTESPTTESPTTDSPTTESPTTESPTTNSPATESPTTAQPTSKPTTRKPSTRKPSTRKPSTRKPTTSKPIL